MNRGQVLIQFIRGVGGSASLGEIQEAFRGTTVAYKFTQSVSEARQILLPKNETIRCYAKRPASLNVYAIEPLLELFDRKAA